MNEESLHPRDRHATYLDDLELVGDWAGLVRYWIAHQHTPALHRAVALVKDYAERYEGRWTVLAPYLQSVLQGSWIAIPPLATRTGEPCAQDEAATMAFL